MKLQLLTDTGRVIESWDLDGFATLGDLGVVVDDAVRRLRTRQDERLPDVVPRGPKYRLVVSTGTSYPYVDTCEKCRRFNKFGGPSHDGSAACQSGSIASGGTRAHCSCEACW